MSRSVGGNKLDRKQSVVNPDGLAKAAGRKHSIIPDRKLSMDRRQSMAVDRKQSLYSDVGTRKSSLDPMGSQNKTLQPYAERRPSISDPAAGRRMSVVESNTGRSTLINTSAHGQRTAIKYENTYKTVPDTKIRGDKVRNCIKKVFEKELPGRDYNKEECTALSKKLAETIKQEVKVLGYFRYKVITVVAIGQNQDIHPSVAFTSRCLWNANFDTFVEHTFKSTALYAVGLVYVLYTE